MTRKILVLEKGGKSESIPLNKEKIVFGRDASCDVCLDDPAISRKHAVVMTQFDQVYIENVSSSGQILRGDEPVEYVQMDEEAEFHLGPYLLLWKLENQADMAQRENALVAESQEPNFSESQNAEPDPNATVPSAPNDVSQEDPFAGVRDEVGQAEVNANEYSPESQLPVLENAENLDNGMLNNAEENNVGEFEGNEIAIDTAASTKVTNMSAKPMLKILKGEEIGRQIKLDYGFQWMVGRSPRSHVQVNNAKLSRQHFKIYKVGNVYRLQDLGSSHGTRINGVTITDAPLQPFDTIQAGPVEIQYLLVDAKISEEALKDVGQPQMLDDGLNAPATNVLLETVENNEKTNFSPPVPYSVTPFSGQQIPLQDVDLNFNFNGIGGAPRAPSDDELNAAKGPISKFVVWYKVQPKPRQVSLMLLALVVVAALVVFGSSENENTPEVKVASVEKKETPGFGAPVSSSPTELSQSVDVSADFDLLPEEQKMRIKELYATAERAKMAKDWQKAFDSASEIVRFVKRYKKTTDIILEAQTYITDSSVGNLAPALKDLAAAQKETEEQLNLLCSEGERAIKEERWEDALESFGKGLNLDPKSSCAEKGYAASIAKNSNLLGVDLPKAPEVPKVDPEAEAIQKARDDMEGLKTQYISAKDKINQGRASESLPELFDLKEKLKDRLNGYSYGVRAPASVRDELLTESKALMSRVEEGVAAMKAKLKADYQIQLADAEQFVANKQYAQARDVYDKILENEPIFEEVTELREKLYTKIIAEARNKYQEGLIYESVGDVDNAIEGYEKTKELLANVNVFTASEYFSKANSRLGRLKR